MLLLAAISVIVGAALGVGLAEIPHDVGYTKEPLTGQGESANHPPAGGAPGCILTRTLT
jgi:hypothetical protein